MQHLPNMHDAIGSSPSPTKETWFGHRFVSGQRWKKNPDDFITKYNLPVDDKLWTFKIKMMYL